MADVKLNQVSEKTGFSRFTLAQAAQQGRLGESAKRDGRFWLIDTEHEDYKTWLQAHQYQPRVRGRAKNKQELVEP